MDGPVLMLHKTQEAEQPSDTNQAPKKKKRIGFFGALFRLLLAFGILGGAGYYAFTMVSARPEPPKREPRERTFTVQSTPATFGAFQPSLVFYGEVTASRTLDIRSQVAGKIVDIAPALEIGTEVKKGQLIAAIDDFNYRGALTEANASLAEAEFSLAEASERLALERANLQFVQSQYDLAVRDFERAKSLFDAGSITEKSLDDRELIVSQREQAVLQRQSNIVIQEAQLSRQQAALERIQWQVERAERNVEDTKIFAPFDGIITADNVELGRVINNNEVLISLYEKDALGVRFTMSDQQFGQLSNDGLIGREIEVVWEVDPQPIVASANIDRVGAQIDATKGGVEVNAEIKADASASLRPGTFVKINVPGLSFDNVLRVPEAAVYDNAYVYVDVDGRMTQRNVEILERDGEYLLVSARIRPGTPIITTRLAQAGEGVAIVNEGEPAPLPFARQNRGDGAQGQRPGGGQRGEGQRPNAQNGENAGQGEGQGQRPNRPNRRQNNGQGSGITTAPTN